MKRTNTVTHGLAALGSAAPSLLDESENYVLYSAMDDFSSSDFDSNSEFSLDSSSSLGDDDVLDFGGVEGQADYHDDDDHRFLELQHQHQHHGRHASATPEAASKPPPSYFEDDYEAGLGCYAQIPQDQQLLPPSVFPQYRAVAALFASSTQQQQRPSLDSLRVLIPTTTTTTTAAVAPAAPAPAPAIKDLGLFDHCEEEAEDVLMLDSSSTATDSSLNPPADISLPSPSPPPPVQAPQQNHSTSNDDAVPSNNEGSCGRMTRSASSSSASAWSSLCCSSSKPVDIPPPFVAAATAAASASISACAGGGLPDPQRSRFMLTNAAQPPMSRAIQFDTTVASFDQAAAIRTARTVAEEERQLSLWNPKKKTSASTIHRYHPKSVRNGSNSNQTFAAVSRHHRRRVHHHPEPLMLRRPGGGGHDIFDLDF